MVKLHGHKQFVNQMPMNALRASLLVSKPDVVMWPPPSTHNHWSREIRCRHMNPLEGPSLQIFKPISSICALILAHMYGLNIPIRRGRCATCSHNTNPSVFGVSANAYLFLIELQQFLLNKSLGKKLEWSKLLHVSSPWIQTPKWTWLRMIDSLRCCSIPLTPFSVSIKS